MANRGFEIRRESVASLSDYFTVPIAFTVERRLKVEPIDGGLSGFRFVEVAVEPPYWKDYDEHESPERWLKHGSLANWGFWGAYTDGRRVGGAVGAWDTPGVRMLKGRRDLAVLWDIRVHPDYRGAGLGRELFQSVAKWARANGCTMLSIETQDINVPACRFYHRQGCVLSAIDRFAYPDHPEEAQLIWTLVL